MKRRGVYGARPEGVFLIRPIYAAWVLLSVEPGASTAARCFRLPDCAVLPFDSVHTRVLCRQTERSTLSLDVCLLRHFHSCLRQHTRNGSVDPVACGLLVVRIDQSNYRRRLRHYCHPTYKVGPARRSTAKSCGTAV